MTEIISQRELRNESGRIMRELDAGRSFVITRNAQTVGELRPLRRPRMASREDLLAAFQSAPGINARQFRRDIDAYVDQGIDPRA